MPRVLNYKMASIPEGAVYIGRANPRHGLPASKWAKPCHGEVLLRLANA